VTRFLLFGASLACFAPGVALFRHVALDLGTSPDLELPTDERVIGYNTTVDPALAAPYFQVGRCLSMSSSRPGTQPANLRGIWNELMAPPWDGKNASNLDTEVSAFDFAPGQSRTLGPGGSRVN
jgi:hypothetical protein